MSGLRADVLVRRGGFTLDVRIEVGAGEVLAVLGPNGAGKSTLLGALTGELPAREARISLGGRSIETTPTHRRGIAVLSQAPLLFPHLSVLANVAFGPRSLGKPRAEANTLAGELLGKVDAAELSARKPSAISGGQAQRVALARALAVDPELLLLDEPFAALDVTSAPRMRALIAEVLDARPDKQATILVTHDPLDALVLADRVAVLDNGRIVEQGPTREVLSAPSTPFAARIAGLNLVEGVLTAKGLRTGDAELIAAGERPAGAPGAAVFAPTAVAVYPEVPPEGSPRNVAPAVLASIERAGDLVRLGMAGTDDGPRWVAGVHADITPAALAELGIRQGQLVWIVVKATEIGVHPRRAP